MSLLCLLDDGVIETPVIVKGVFVNMNCACQSAHLLVCYMHIYYLALIEKKGVDVGFSERV